jgi:hypothetical protein
MAPVIVVAMTSLAASFFHREFLLICSLLSGDLEMVSVTLGLGVDSGLTWR